MNGFFPADFLIKLYPTAASIVRGMMGSDAIVIGGICREIFISCGSSGDQFFDYFLGYFTSVCSSSAVAYFSMCMGEIWHAELT